MNGVWSWVVAAIAALIGYLVGSSRAKEVRAATKHDLKIKIKKNGSDYSSETDHKEKRVHGWDFVEWQVHEPSGHALPAGSHVFLRFAAGSPLIPSEPTDLGSRTILTFVKPGQSRKGYEYKVYYRLNGAEHLLEDPVLIIEGDRTVN